LYALTEIYLDLVTTLSKRLESQPLEHGGKEALDERLGLKKPAPPDNVRPWEQEVTKWRDLASQYKQVLRPPQPEPESLYVLSKVYGQLAQLTAERVWDLKPDYYRSHQLLGQAYEAKEDYEKALLEYQQALRLSPQSPGLHYLIGHAYWQMKRFYEAIPELEKELALNPYHASANYVLGHIYLYLDRQQPEKAARYLRRAVEADRNFVEARKQWGKALSLLHDNQKALEELQLAAAADPGDDSVHYLLAGVYKKMGLPDKAQKELETFNQLRRRKHIHDKPQE
jgi:tetratricopeptide (TPR) repeat protein